MNLSCVFIIRYAINYLFLLLLIIQKHVQLIMVLLLLIKSNA